jgi:signal transduction histidine kinase
MLEPMPTDEPPSPLAVAALALVGDGVTAAGLVERFAAIGAGVDQDAAGARLDELSRLGLTRLVPSGSGGGTYLLTALGERLLAASFVAGEDHANLLAEIEQMRTELLSTIAHELRTPLTAVRTSIGLLLDADVQPTPDQHRALLESIDRNATRMQRLVGDILDLSRFRAGSVQLQLRRFDATALARSAVASVEPLAESRGQGVALDAPADPVWVFGDYRRLEQALVNVLSNALKYSPDGAAIDVTVAGTDAEVSWTVTDRGVGIDPADQARLFERFFVAGGTRSEASPGIGLGLPISLMILQAHEGRIEVDSQPGSGSTFRIIVPAAGPQHGGHE